ncbi:MAG: hypothetical protein FWD34_02315 [Oscillospiraceae bacterium]|nr:hypothetical protein [Oscillospiraceae bacterium]
MNILPNADKAVIPVRKFTEYALHPVKGKGKAYAFEQALGYDLTNYNILIKNIKDSLIKFKATSKGDNGFGIKYEVLMILRGENGKSANVLTSWIVEHNGETRLTSAYITNREVEK